MTTAHTVTKWFVQPFDGAKGVQINIDCAHGPICIGTMNSMQLAERAVLTHNAHDDLVKAVQQLLPRLAPAYKGTFVYRDALDALAKAGAA